MKRCIMLIIFTTLPCFAGDLGWGIGVGYGDVDPNISYSEHKTRAQFFLTKQLSAFWDLELKTFRYDSESNLVGGSHSFEMETLMLSGVYRPCRSRACPYLGAGISSNRSKQRDVMCGYPEQVLEAHEGTHVGWQAFVGAELRIQSRLMLFGEIRYLRSPNPAHDPLSLETRIASLGLRYGF